MREVTIRLHFVRPCLGNVQDRQQQDGKLVYLMPRTPGGKTMFMPSWHKSNFKLAASVLGRLQNDVGNILWDAAVEGTFLPDRWFRRYYNGRDGKRRYDRHEAFMPGQVVDINACVPANISDDDFIKLMNLAGRYKGLSPWSPGDFGLFEVVGLSPRRLAPPEESESQPAVPRQEAATSKAS